MPPRTIETDQSTAWTQESPYLSDRLQEENGAELLTETSDQLETTMTETNRDAETDTTTSWTYS